MMRVHELAKELGTNGKDLLARLQELHIEAKNNMTMLEDPIVERIRRAWKAMPVSPTPKAPPVKKTAKPKTAKTETEPKPEAEPTPEPVKPAAAKAAPEKKPAKTVETPAPEAPSKPAEPTPEKPAAAKTSKVAKAEHKPDAEAVPVPAPKPAKAAAKAESKLPEAPAPAEVPEEPCEGDKAAAKSAAPAPALKPAAPSVDAEAKIIRLRGPVLVKDLADGLGIRPNKLIAELMSFNVLASINELLDINTARKVAEKVGFTVEHEKRTTEHSALVRRKPDEEQSEEVDRPEDMAPRPPVVTFMGHVDHGKTSLLDRIRNTAVAKQEFGGITQHIGASTVSVSGRMITFLDTPGHEAFTAMRARGANMTDIAVIVVAADDGIMPQTREALQHAKAAKVSVMVAINKIDLPAANVMRVKQQLQGEGLAPEDWGGEVICVPVSAQTGEGIPQLLEMLLLQADVLELKANPRRRARGFVIEAQMEPGMGPTASLLVSAGTLKVGDAILCGSYNGRVRALINDRGVKVNSAAPGCPVKCLGLSGVPDAGAAFQACENDRAARALAEQESARMRTEQVTAPRKASLDDLLAKIEDSKRVELKLVLRADTQGSVEAITHALQQIKSDKVSLNVVLSGTGNVTGNDVMLASASGAIIMGFHVGKEPGVEAEAKHEGVEVIFHNIIYEIVDRIRDAMAGLLTPEIRQKTMGRALVKAVFPMSKGSKVAGCVVTSGNVRPRYKIRVRRNDEVLFEGTMLTLKRFQDTASEVKEGQECGIRIERYSEFREGDILEFYELEEIKQSL